jgi:hypothetical protein
MEQEYTPRNIGVRWIQKQCDGVKFFFLFHVIVLLQTEATCTIKHTLMFVFQNNTLFFSKPFMLRLFSSKFGIADNYIITIHNVKILVPKSGVVKILFVIVLF